MNDTIRVTEKWYPDGTYTVQIGNATPQPYLYPTGQRPFVVFNQYQPTEDGKLD